MDDGMQPVTRSADRDALRRKATRIHVQSAAAAVVLALVGLAL